MGSIDEFAELNAIAVYCASSPGKRPEYHQAAMSLGRAMAANNRPLIYGGGSKGIMGTISGSVLENGGKVTGITPYAMVADKVSPKNVGTNEKGREKVETILVNSMHDRKVEMARRSGAFIGLPGGFGTFEEVLEVSTWTQLGIHNKPVILINVLSFWEPLRQLIQNGVEEGLIQPHNASLVVFIDGPSEHKLHAEFDWGRAALEAIDEWRKEWARTPVKPMFDWTKRMESNGNVPDMSTLGAS